MIRLAELYTNSVVKSTLTVCANCFEHSEN